MGEPERGYDGIKRLAGRKRHLLFDTGDSCSVPAFTPPACTSGTAGGSFPSDELKAGLPTLAVVRAGAAYTGKWEGRSP